MTKARGASSRQSLVHGGRWRLRWPRCLGSLRSRLLVALLAVVAAMTVVQGVLAYRGALAEADVLQDDHMRQTALALGAGLPLDAQSTWRGADSPAPGEAQHDFIVQVWTHQGLRLFESVLGTRLPPLAVMGFQEVPIQGTTYRVFSLRTRSQVIQVAQDVAVRRSKAGRLALRTVAPMALLLPLLAFTVGWAVMVSLAPVQRVRRQLAERQADALSPVDAAGLPDEVRPLVDELNLLFARVQQAFDAQQHFVADAAHELRSPLAALRLQVQGLQRASDEADRAVAVGRLVAGIDRATRLVEQLLTLARQEARLTSDVSAQPVELAGLARQAVLDAAHAAQLRGIDLGLGDCAPGAVWGHPDALQILLRNLVENALKYTPAGGVVDVSVQIQGRQRVLVVEDSGPGIAPADRAQMLARFHRATAVSGAEASTGSGLGLAIVQAIARLHGSEVVLDASERLGGLRVQLPLTAVDGPAPV